VAVGGFLGAAQDYGVGGAELVGDLDLEGWICGHVRTRLVLRGGLKGVFCSRWRGI